MFANSPTETKTATEKAFVAGFAKQIGNIGRIMVAIAGAVFFTILLVTANTMAQSIRERTNELAVLKTLGFSDGARAAAGAGRVLPARHRRRRARAWRWPGRSSRTSASDRRHVPPLYLPRRGRRASAR